nr:DMT family transporter [Caldimonas thermodepolymerans]
MLATTVLWGTSLPVIKLLSTHFDPLWLSGLRMGVACLPQALLVLHARPSGWALNLRQLCALTACGILMVYINQWLLAVGIARSSATNASLITALNPLLSGLVALLLLGERLGGRRLAGAMLGLAGVALVILHRPAAELAEAGVGDLLVLLAVLSFTFGAVLVQRLARGIDALRISLFVHAVGAACLLLHGSAQAWATGAAPRLSPDPLWWWVAVLSGVVSTGIGGLMWNVAIGRIGMSRASVWLYWMPVFSVLVSVLFLGESLTLWHLVGLGLVLAGTRLGTRSGGARPA